MRRSGRYVVLLHDHPVPHLDWMLEAGGALATWRVPCAPADVPPGGAGAERIADHRLEWLSREGAVSGGRGTARRVEAGAYEAEVEGDRWDLLLGGRRFTIASGRVAPG